MKAKLIVVLAVALMVASLAVSGCTSPVKKVTGSSDQVTPTATPGSGKPSSGAGDGSSPTTKSLFDTSNLKYYEWRWTSVSNGETDTFNYRVERGTESYNGAQTKFKKVTFTSKDQDPSSITLYFDATGEKAIAYKVDDQVYEITQDNEAMAHMFDGYDVGLMWANYDYDLSNGVPDVLNINGKTYTAQKYAVGTIYGSSTIWSATVDGKQMCVQLEYKDAKGDSLKYQLWDWG